MLLTVTRSSVSAGGSRRMRLIASAVVLGFAIQRLTQRLPWPADATPLRRIALQRPRSSRTQGALNSGLERACRSFVSSSASASYGSRPGFWVYVMIAACSMPLGDERARASRAVAARSQLAACDPAVTAFPVQRSATVVQPSRATTAPCRLRKSPPSCVHYRGDADVVPLAANGPRRALPGHRSQCGRISIRYVRTEPGSARRMLPSFGADAVATRAPGFAPRVDHSVRSLDAGRSDLITVTTPAPGCSRVLAAAPGPASRGLGGAPVGAVRSSCPARCRIGRCRCFLATLVSQEYG